MTIDEQLAILQAVKDGKRVDVTCPGDTSDWLGTVRRAREPLECWVNVSPGNFPHVPHLHQSEAAAKAQAGANAIRIIVPKSLVERLRLCEGADLSICLGCARMIANQPAGTDIKGRETVPPTTTTRCAYWMGRLPAHAVTPTDRR